MAGDSTSLVIPNLKVKIVTETVKLFLLCWQNPEKTTFKGNIDNELTPKQSFGVNSLIKKIREIDPFKSF